MTSRLFLVLLCTTGSVAFETYPGEGEIASLLQMHSESDEDLEDRQMYLPSIECEIRIGSDDSCANHFQNMSINTLAVAPVSHAIPCKLCFLRDCRREEKEALSGRTPVVFSMGRHDGLGSRLYNVIFHLAVAWRHSLSFGGFIEVSRKASALVVGYNETLSTVLGFNYKQLHAPVPPQHFGTCVSGCYSTEKMLQISQRTKSILLDATWGDVFDVLTPEFLEKWRAVSGLQRVALPSFKDSKFNIAIHVRRGDVTKDRHGPRWLEDQRQKLAFGFGSGNV